MCSSQCSRTALAELQVVGSSHYHLTALEIFDPTLLPPTKREWLRVRHYQDAAVDTLSKQYSQPMNCGGKTWPALIRGTHFQQEWAVLSEELADSCGTHTCPQSLRA